ncbi:hypothetical protein [uncultured Brevundimonas sp.]|uniref:hypothetical protein n=1 Tax=uncultured Brevundimonas sp. TaxID=213418 RepID=UPI000FAFA966|nr:hypothetical protein [uncultured Brevundimonas sp.]
MTGAVSRLKMSGWRALATGLAAAFGMAAPAQAQVQSLAPDAAPAAWVAYAEIATRTVKAWLEEDGPPASNLRLQLHQTRPAPDQPTPPLELKLWIEADGVVSHVEAAPPAKETVSVDLQSSVQGRRLAPPPPGMLQPLRLAVQLEP